MTADLPLISPRAARLLALIRERGFERAAERWRDECAAPPVLAAMAHGRVVRSLVRRKLLNPWTLLVEEIAR